MNRLDPRRPRRPALSDEALPRRNFLMTSLVGVASAARAGVDEKRAPVVDTHAHCFAGKHDKRFPYHPQGIYQPDEVASPENLLRAMDGAGVDFAVIVHPEPYQDDHRYQERCLEVGGKRFKGTCLLFADRPGVLDAMKQLARKWAPVSARIHAYDPARLPPFGKPELRAYWKRAGELEMAVQLHFEPRYAAGFEPLIKEFTDVRVVIDHLGRPFDGTPREFDTVLGWARYRNTIMKLSSVPNQRTYPDRPIGPIIKRLVEAWGAERLVYGGGWQGDAAGRGYRAERERVAGYLTDLPAVERAKILGGNAARLFRFQV
jgi:predicted TIM-barrel fold metal-dependent hydrolase